MCLQIISMFLEVVFPQYHFYFQVDDSSDDEAEAVPNQAQVQ